MQEGRQRLAQGRCGARRWREGAYHPRIASNIRRKDIAPRQRNRGEDPADRQVLPERSLHPKEREHEQLGHQSYEKADEDVGERLDERHQPRLSHVRLPGAEPAGKFITVDTCH